MKKKILMLVMAISMVCLVGCKKDEVTPSVPNVPNNNGTTVVDSGDVIRNESDISGDEIYSGDIEEIIPELLFVSGKKYTGLSPQISTAL